MHFSKVILPLALLTTMALATDKASKPLPSRVRSWVKEDSQFMDKLNVVREDINYDELDDDFEAHMYAKTLPPYSYESSSHEEFFKAIEATEARCLQWKERNVPIRISRRWRLWTRAISHDENGMPMRAVEKIISNGQKQIYRKFSFFRMWVTFAASSRGVMMGEMLTGHCATVTDDVKMKKSNHQAVNALLEKLYTNFKSEDCE